MKPVHQQGTGLYRKSVLGWSSGCFDFHLKGFDIYDPMQNYRIDDDSLYCEDGGIYGYECDFEL